MSKESQDAPGVSLGGIRFRFWRDVLLSAVGQVLMLSVSNSGAIRKGTAVAEGRKIAT